MPTTRDKLVFRALCVLDEAIELATDQPIQAGLGVKLALAYLWTVARHPQRSFFTTFCDELADAHPTAPSAMLQTHLRTTRARSCLKAIARSCGYGETPEHWQALSDARRTGRWRLPG